MQRNSQDPEKNIPFGRTLYCNQCNMYVKPVKWDGEEICPYHQRTMRTEDGIEFMYDEFDQNGE